MPDNDPTKPEQALRGLPVKQDPTAAPVIIAPRLPVMEKAGAVSTVLRNTLLPLMGAGPPRPTGGEGLMTEVPAQEQASAPFSGKPQEPKAAPPAPKSEGGYVRVEVHVENGKLSVVGMTQVPGPLAMPSAVIHGYAYEVLLNDQQIALGSLPDVGVRRAFANRNVEGPQGKHFFADLPTFDFIARIPRGYLVTANLPRLNIVLHKVEEAPDRFTSLAPLMKQTGVKTTEVGRLAGLRLEALAPGVRSTLQEILSEGDRRR